MQQRYQCPRCGAQVVFGARFCGSCQTPLNWPAPQQPTVQQPPSPPLQQPAQYQQQYQQPQQPGPSGYQQQPEPPKKKSSKLGIISLAIVLLALAAVGSCVVCVMQPGSSEAPVSTPQTSPVVDSSPAYWAEVIRWEGNSIKDTETFSITANDWRIRWSTEPGEYGDMNFQIYIYEANGSLKNIAANIIGEGSDVSYVRGAGDYYLTINTGQPYTVIIEQKQ